MKSFVPLFTAIAGLVSFAVAEIGIYGQCGGANYKGETACVRGTVCTVVSEHYSWCDKPPRPSTKTTRAVNPIVDYASLGGTTGGTSGATTRVSTLAGLKSAVSGNSVKTVILTASLTGNEIVDINSNTTLLGANGGITLKGIGLRVLNKSNVIVRNLKISKVLASTNGDAIGIQKSSRVWIDHVDLSSDLDHGKDYYDGLVDITHGCTYVTVSWSYLHDHWKGSLIGDSDNTGNEDKAMTVTYHHNHFARVNSRTPSFRFGTGHIYNNYFDGGQDGIDTRNGAQLLVENNVFVDTRKPIFSENNGYVVSRGNDFGGAACDAPTGTLTSVPYNCTLSSLDSVRSDVLSGAGANLYF